MSKLGISQVPGVQPAQFIARNRDTEQSAPPAVVPSPYDWPVPGAGTEPLMTQLRWYFETFLGYPFEPYITRAAEIEDALKAWGTATFKALFNNLEAGQWLPRQAGAVLDILISCDEPELLAWPWEALHDPVLGYFGHRARIQRRLSLEAPEPPKLPALPKDCIHVLLITARPFEHDVSYRSVSRPLVELIRREQLPASVHVLRPPTFDNLLRDLNERPGFYHILHFDGHGGYGTRAPELVSGHFRGHEGRLMFETDTGQPDEVTADRLATMLAGCRVPFVVLNACRSAQLDAQAAEGRAFASVAGALVHAGFRGVLGMAYNLTVRGAQQFLPAFYQHLFKQGNLLEAAREGRLRMFDQASRSAWNPKVTLQDWLLPVVYQQREDFGLGFAQQAAPPADAVPLPEAATVAETLAFVGRDAAIQALERELRAPAAGVLVHGLGGVGKTTLARHFLQWLRDTGGLTHPPLWFGFDDIRSAEFVFNQTGRALFGAQFDSAQPQHYAALVKALREKPLLLVWDNFESACGFEPERVSGQLSEADLGRLRDFLKALHGGQTKVLLTSRSEEAWLPPEHCHRLHLGGLRGEELWDYAAAVIEALQLPVDRQDKDLQALVVDLDGHPVLIRAVLAQIPRQTAASLRQQWLAKLPAFVAQVKDPAYARLLASLDLAGASFAEAERPYLVALALHERHVDLRLLHAMGRGPAAAAPLSPTGGEGRGEGAVPGYRPELMEQIVARLVRAGLLTGVWQNIFAIHPLLTSYLRSQTPLAATAPQHEAWERAFVEVMGRLADALAPKQLHEQRDMFGLHHANFHRALELAASRDMTSHVAALTQSLAAYAQNTRNYAEAAVLFQRLAESRQRAGDAKVEASAYHNLGRIAQEQRDFAGAERWYLKSIAISEKQGDEHGAAMTYGQLGSIAQEQRDFAGAERWYLKSLAIEEKQGNEHGAALTYHNLGSIAQEQRDLAGAERWYLKSLAIFEKQGDEHSAAMTYHNLGSIAQEQRDLAGAERWYLKSLAIFEKQGDEHGAAMTYHNLGSIAQEQRDLAGAERWYLKSLAIEEKQGNEHGAAMTYHNLGSIAQERGDHLQSGELFLKAFSLFAASNDQHYARVALGNFALLLRNAPRAASEKLRALGLKTLGPELMGQIERAVKQGEKA
jgi:tetratricopeptide (TPR) repeat protein